MRFTTFLVSLFCVLLTCGFTNQSLSQRAIGVQWSIPESKEKALEELHTFQELGITHLEISSQPNDEIWTEIDRVGFQVYGQVPVDFPLVQTFSEPDSSSLKTFNNAITQYTSHPSVQHLGLFKYGAVYNPAFETTLQPLIQQLRNDYSGGFYYITTKSTPAPVDELVDFKILEISIGKRQDYLKTDSLSDNIHGIIYHPDKEISFLLRPFDRFLRKFGDRSGPIFVTSQWLFQMLREKPDFANTLKLYNSDSEFIFPIPEERYNTSSDHSLVVLLLVFIWCIFAVNYHMSPVYRKSLTRYFVGHVFFVEDVMDRHIRSIGPVITILIQNILLAGVCIYTLSSSLFSSLGLEAIFYHYPVLSLFNNPLYSSFLWGCTAGAVLTLVSVVWINISNKKIRTLRQVLNLYAWPLQINFIIVTIMVTLLMAGNYSSIVLLLSLAFAGIHISAFIISAFDTSRYLSGKKVLFLSGTIGLYCLILAGLTFWIIQSSLPEVIQLALSL